MGCFIPVFILRMWTIFCQQRAVAERIRAQNLRLREQIFRLLLQRQQGPPQQEVFDGICCQCYLLAYTYCFDRNPCHLFGCRTIAREKHGIHRVRCYLFIQDK